MPTVTIAPIQRYESGGRLIDLICNPVLPVAGRKRFQDRSLMSRRFGRERSRRGRVKFLRASCPVGIVAISMRDCTHWGRFHG